MQQSRRSGVAHYEYGRLTTIAFRLAEASWGLVQLFARSDNFMPCTAFDGPD